MICVPRHATAPLAFLVDALNEEHIRNDFKAVNGEPFCHLAGHDAVWEGDGDGSSRNDPNVLSGTTTHRLHHQTATGTTCELVP